MPAAAVADEDIWNKAKKSVDKAKTPPDSYYAVVMDVYKKMGGKLKGKTKKEDIGAMTDEQKLDRAKKLAAPYRGESLHPWIVAELFKKMGGTVAKREDEGGDDVPSDGDSPMPSGSASDADSEARKILVDSPDISAATFYNTLKSKGIELTKREADTASSLPQTTRAGVAAINPLAHPVPGLKKKKKKELGLMPWQQQQLGKLKVKPVTNGKKESSISFRAVRLIERAAADDGIGPTRFRSVLIQEGLGNLRDRYYYTKEALETALPIFEGKKIYADHPSSIEEQSRPERSVRDILGYFENVQLEENEEGQAILVGDIHMMDEEPYSWARGIMRHAVEYSKKFSDKDFVGLSINASGDAEEVALDEFLKENSVPESARLKLNKAKDEGIDKIKVVSSITDAISCDLVTEAGAGGKVMEMIEKEKKMAKKAKIEEKKMEACEEEKVKASEVEGDEAEEKKEAVPAAKADGDGGDDHTDAPQDEELFKKMMKKHMGDKQEMDEMDEGEVRQAYQAAREMGYEAEEAMKMATGYAKMAKHLAAKKAKEIDEAEEDESDETSEAKGEPSTDDGGKHPAGAAESEKKESEILVLKGEVAKLKETIKGIQLDKYLDKKLKETRLPFEQTKKIRESLGAVKSERQIDGAIASFMNGWNAHGEMSEIGLIVNVEKTGEMSDKLILSDCLN